MQQILDLGLFAKNTMPVLLPDGRTLNLMQPSKDDQIELMRFRGVTAKSDPQEIIEALNEIVIRILNSNDSLVSIPAEWVQSELNIAQKTALVQAYTSWINELLSDPNS